MTVIHFLLGVWLIMGSIFDSPLDSAGKLATIFGDKKSSQSSGYEWREAEHLTYFPGRHADVIFNGIKVGDFGIVHPDVLRNFEISHPVTALELSIEPFCFDQMQRPLRTHAVQ